MKWIVDGRTFDDARNAAEYIMENCSDDPYDEMLDEIYGDIEICGYSYCASIALYRVDPIAYKVGRSDWEDSEASEIEWQLERMDDGDTDTFYGVDVEAVEDEEDEDEEDEEE